MDNVLIQVAVCRIVLVLVCGGGIGEEVGTVQHGVAVVKLGPVIEERADRQGVHQQVGFCDR
jgi:hypothetical protein